jgi:hypothetical protein
MQSSNRGRASNSAGQMLRSGVRTLIVLIIATLPDASAFAQEVASRNRFEVRAGWEVNRQSLVGVIGYDIALSERWDIIPQLNYVAVLTPAVTVRCHVPVSGIWSVGISGGLGLNFPPIIPHITGIAALSTRLATGTGIVWSIEVRLIRPFLNRTEDVEVGGTLPGSRIRSLRDYPPIALSLGIEL